jgi:hypothetical protein
MARYILIDHNSGYIWGDSADLDGKIFTGTPAEYAIALDTSLNNYDGSYTYCEVYENTASKTYDVYRVDIDGSEIIPVVRDGQDQETIDAVTERGRYVTSLAREFTDDAETD